jgi:hypothetical protein
MAHSHTPIRSDISGLDQRRDTGTDHRIPVAAPHKVRIPPFWRHFLQMLAAMAVGMIATGAIFLSVVGLKTWDQVTLQYPTQALLAMAAGMTIPMVAWMLFRGMGRRNSYEMAAAMVLPVVPFLCLVWFHVTNSAQCGAYCAVTIVAMLGLMFYRRDVYSMPMRGPAAPQAAAALAPPGRRSRQCQRPGKHALCGSTDCPTPSGFDAWDIHGI